MLTGSETQSQAAPAAAHAAELSVIIPCYNERGNVGPMVAQLAAALGGIAWEAIFVDDDSPDGTSDVARAIAVTDPRVRCIRRIGRRGLSSAVIEGSLSSSAKYFAVIDGDRQHDETRLPEMLRMLREDGADVVVASRFADGGDAAGLSSAWRYRLSTVGISLVHKLLPVKLTDPMSGFFAGRRDLFEQTAPSLTGQGFKILLDYLLSTKTPPVVREIGATFRPRVEGESKLSILVIVQFGALLLDKLFHGMVPLRFMSFAGVGFVGLIIHYLVLMLSLSSGITFGLAQTGATLVAMLTNFQLNNAITYRDMKLKGSRLWRGLVEFMLVCGIGAAANIGIARMLYYQNDGVIWPGLLGAAIGLVWNYAVSSTLVWRARRR